MYKNTDELRFNCSVTVRKLQHFFNNNNNNNRNHYDALNMVITEIYFQPIQYGELTASWP